MPFTPLVTQVANCEIWTRKGQKSAMKYSVEKPILLNFASLSTILFPKLRLYIRSAKSENFCRPISGFAQNLRAETYEL